jgi:hypothetical protein
MRYFKVTVTDTLYETDDNGFIQIIRQGLHKTRINWNKLTHRSPTLHIDNTGFSVIELSEEEYLLEFI